MIPPGPVLRFPVEHGWLRRDGVVFRSEDNRIWHYRGFTAFLLFWRFLNGEDITPQLDQYQSLGANVLRVLGMVGWDTLSPRFFPANYPQYFVQLDAFMTLCESRGMRVEFVIFADAQLVMPSTTGEHDRDRDSRLNMHAARVTEVLERHWCALSETCNEPFKNGVNVHTVVPPASRVLRASGKYDLPDGTIGAPGPNLVLEHLEYVTTHSERKDEWPRTGKDLQELCYGWPAGVNGSGQPYRGLDGTNCPVVGDESMGADEDNKPGSRSNIASDFRDYAACCALMGAGATFHSTDGLNAVLLRPKQYECAWGFFTAFLMIPPEAQIAPYQRGSEFGGAGIGNMPMDHTDALALRTFCKEVNGIEYCVAIRATTEWVATGRDGWRVVSEPARGLVTLSR